VCVCLFLVVGVKLFPSPVYLNILDARIFKFIAYNCIEGRYHVAVESSENCLEKCLFVIAINSIDFPKGR
jgi:hypothetical protein